MRTIIVASKVLDISSTWLYKTVGKYPRTPDADELPVSIQNTPRYFADLVEYLRTVVERFPDARTGSETVYTMAFEQLDATAHALSDNEGAKQMNEAKRQLLKAIFEQGRKAV